jgi:outer membrane lipopolysaccharide assembly protein LptE/RlpB
MPRITIVQWRDWVRAARLRLISATRKDGAGSRGLVTPSVHSYNVLRMIRRLLVLALAVPLAGIAGCGYHTVGAASHLPPDLRTLSVPVFATRTEAYRTETVMTNAVIREFATRTRFRVTPDANPDADAVLHGTILKEVVTPLTYNASTQESSSFLLTMVVSVTLNGRDGKVLYENKNYVFRQQYQSTTDLPTFLQENPAALERLSRDFARALVADVLGGF